jgi:CspA family cold shock protein
LNVNASRIRDKFNCNLRAEPVNYRKTDIRSKQGVKFKVIDIRRRQKMTERESGIVKWFNDSRGYGFIQRDSGGDVFVHYSAILGIGFRSLSEGQRVEYEVIEESKGLQAQNVYIVNSIKDVDM